MDRQAKDHHISVELPDDLLMAKMDVRLIVQVIINIVNNAIKYTPAGSHIVLRAEKRGAMAAVSIADDGPGISDEAKAHLFDMFYTASQGKADNRRGLGLGLNLCRSIVTAHGGEITVADHLPQGSVFFLHYLWKRWSCTMYKSKILVVEDDPAISNLIRTTLETQEYQYHTAQNGSGALMEVVSYHPDVVILDLGLPDMDGVDIIKKVRGFSAMPIIVVSAH